MPDLSIIIPARQEEFLNRTVQDCLDHSTANTEIIVIADGAWPTESLPVHPKVSVIHRPTPLGQRGAVNEGIRISDAPYVMKLDAHCALAPGFDTVLLDAAKTLPANVIQIPAQRNLHVFNWVCDACGRRDYQGPTLPGCRACQQPVHREMVWKPRDGTTTTRWCFDRDLKFTYWNGGAKTGLTETLSCLGACWFVNRAHFWTLGGLDEAHGSWGQMGTELGCKAWLSGGQMLVNHGTWFAHLFRTQGADFGFPYEIHGRDQEKARVYSRDLWRHNKWPGQIHPFTWLLDKFWPINGWTQADRDALEPTPAPAPAVPSFALARAGRQTKGIIYYSDGHAPSDVLQVARDTIEAAALPIVAVTLRPLHWPAAQIVTLPMARSYLTMFKQILIALELLDTDFVYFCEHDLLYPPDHFTFTPHDRDHYFYNQHVWKVDPTRPRAVHYRCSQTSGLCGDRKLLLQHYRTRVDVVEAHGFSRAMGFEPGTHHRPERVDDVTAQVFMSTRPLVDIRHGQNLTPSRWRKDQFRNPRYTDGWTESDVIPGWGPIATILTGGTDATQQAIA